MLFPTLSFGLFFLAVFPLAWLLRRAATARKIMLLVASYAFYASWDWRFMGLLAGSSTLNYVAGLLLLACRSERQKSWVTGIAVALNLGVLGFFKYYGFFLDSLAGLLAPWGLDRDLPFLEIILPVGISFFTFHGISYVVDVRRGEVEACRSPLDLFLYISFFPQLVAGPIVRAAYFLPQLKRHPELDRGTLAHGIVLILAGLLKKTVVASILATDIVDPAFMDPASYGSLDLLVAIYAYAVQIYCDFSGYTDIAIGVAGLLGYSFKPNFNQPYRAVSLQDFWRRWHMSLSQWLRDYLYKPLGGSRHGELMTYRNLLLTMLLGGLWHGAAWTFVLWGAIHGGVLSLERLVRTRLWPGVWTARGVLGAVLSGLGILLTFHVVCLAWIFFRSPDLATATAYLSGLAGGGLAPQLTTPLVAGLVAATLAAQLLLPAEGSRLIARRIEGLGAIWLGLILGLGLALIHALGPEGVAPFIYFQF